MNGLWRAAIGAALLVMVLCSPALAADPDEHKKACLPDQQKAADRALADARSGVQRAIASLKAPSQTDVDRLQKWFGGLGSDTAENVQKVYASSLGSAAFSQFWCPVSNDLAFKWGQGDLAAVHKAAPDSIYLTPDFFRLKVTGADSQMGTLIHELTHLAGVGLKEEVYGTSKAKALALTDPSKARNNSDNFQYYVEDLLFRLP
ncbi:M35 family metallo-endopeptidase [Polaromonas sp. JS666]|uniref:M35 family metallo-endopeptidase n=1 Tax=Polaromonas sp. (strain JS666 / ATCC BAA-500) TaxID=296591 RepID=UPI0000536C95|nr:M35 family metallo-endopeptidase [Polaromonas sp. JS666]